MLGHPFAFRFRAGGSALRGLLLVAAFGWAAVAVAFSSVRDVVEPLLNAQKYAEARGQLQQALARNPDDAEAHYWAGVTAEHLDDTPAAVRHLEKATTLAPQNSDYFLELGGAYGAAAQKAGIFSKLGWAKKCQAALERAVELNPDNLNARSGLASYYRQAPGIAGGGIDKAYAQAEEIKKRSPVAGAVALGQLYVDDRKPEQAFAVYDEALKAQPDHYGLLYGFGRAAAHTGQRMDEGERCLRRCLTLSPQPGDPPFAAVHWRLGQIAQRRGALPASQAEYQKALALNPSFQPAAKSLAALNAAIAKGGEQTGAKNSTPSTGARPPGPPDRGAIP